MPPWPLLLSFPWAWNKRSTVSDLWHSDAVSFGAVKQKAEGLYVASPKVLSLRVPPPSR